MVSLELGVLGYFSAIFPALLVFVIVFAVLEKTKMLGESKILHSIAAFVAMFMVLISDDIIQIINMGAPWFILVFVFLTLLLLIYRFMGASEDDIADAVKDKIVYWTILAISVIIVISSISSIYGQRLLEQQPMTEDGTPIPANATATEGTFTGELYGTLFDPKIIGLIFVFLVAAFSVALLTRDSS